MRKSIVVAATQEHAFRVFTEQMSTWWPLATHHIGEVEAKGGWTGMLEAYGKRASAS